jgi:K+-transporting ATPase ATPase C chain
MKNHILPSIILTFCFILFFCGVYTVVLWGVAQLAPNQGKGFVHKKEGSEGYYYINVGQKFTDDRYFWSRPSAVDYNAAGSGGSNKGPSNPDYLAVVQSRIDSFLVHNPGIEKGDIPADLVTASGSGLDPHISVKAAQVQVRRIAALRGVSEQQLQTLITQNTEKPLLGFMGPERVHVLKLNIDLDKL